MNRRMHTRLVAAFCLILGPPSLDGAQEVVAAETSSGFTVVTEASGGVTLETVGEIAKTSVDVISVGALTHAPKSLDSSLEWKA